MRRLALVFITGSAVATGCASAAVISFDNTAGDFVLVANGGSFSPNGAFDITRSPTDQQNVGGVRTIAYFIGQGGGSETPQGDSISCGLDIRVAQSPNTITVFNNQGFPFTFQPARVLSQGGLISQNFNFQDYAHSALFYNGGNAFHTPFLGQSPFTAFSLDFPDGIHYGFVQWDFRIGPLIGGGVIPMYQPIRWGYESEPGVQFRVPAPGSAAVLLTNFGLLATRRRRRA